jgi:hypothetical protein
MGGNLSDQGQGALPPLADTVSGHLRNALQTINLLEYEAGDQIFPLMGIRRRVEAALIQVEQLREEAEGHPFSFAKHVAETL